MVVFQIKEEVKLYKNLRLLAIDSSVLTLPNTKVLKEKFGSTTNQHKESLAAGRLSCLYDVKNEMVIDVVLSPYNTGERSQAIEHLDYCDSNDLKILSDYERKQITNRVAFLLLNE